jgi:excisionase family DNA binding protein
MDTPKPSSLRPEPWLTAKQAAAHLGLPSRKALYQAVRRGQVPVHRFGKRLRFSRAELDRALFDAAS